MNSHSYRVFPHSAAPFLAFSCPSFKPLLSTNRPLCQTGRHDFSLSVTLSCRHKRTMHIPAASSPRKWKRKCRGDRSVKSPLSPSSSSDRSDTTADNNNNKDSDKRCCRIIHEGRTQLQRSSVSPKLTHSALCVFSKPSRSWVTTPNLHPPRRHFPLNGAHLVWGRKSATLRIQVSKSLFSNLVEKFAVCHNWRSVTEQDNFVWHLSSNKASVTTLWCWWEIRFTSIMRR